MIFKQYEQVLDGTKTQTRRLVKEGEFIQSGPDDKLTVYIDGGFAFAGKYPYLNSREKWAVGHTYAVQPGRGKPAIWWRPDGTTTLTPLDEYLQKTDGVRATWGPKVKRWMLEHGYIEARIRITDIRRERLQNVSEEDAYQELGSSAIPPPNSTDLIYFPKKQFEVLWDSINKKPGTRWADNPEVWALKFELVQ